MKVSKGSLITFRHIAYNASANRAQVAMTRDIISVYSNIDRARFAHRSIRRAIIVLRVLQVIIYSRIHECQQAPTELPKTSIIRNVGR